MILLRRSQQGSSLNRKSGKAVSCYLPICCHRSLRIRHAAFSLELRLYLPTLILDILKPDRRRTATVRRPLRVPHVGMSWTFPAIFRAGTGQPRFVQVVMTDTTAAKPKKSCGRAAFYAWRGSPGCDCTRISSRSCCLNRLSPGLDPSIVSKVRYVVQNIVSINNVFASCYVGES